MNKEKFLFYKKALTAAKKERKSVTDAADSYGYYHYSFIDESLKIRTYYGMSCYGMVASHPLNKKQAPIFFIDNSWGKSLQKNYRGHDNLISISEKEKKEYVKWWIGESFIKGPLVKSCFSTIIENGAIYDAENWPAANIITMGMGLRYLGENTKMIKDWHFFNNFVEPNLAIILAHLFRIDEKQKMLSIKRRNSHTWWQPWYGKEEIYSILNNALLTDKLPTMKNSVKYNPLSQIFQKRTTDASESSIKPDLSFPTGIDLKITNSFGKQIEGEPVYKLDCTEKFIDEFLDLNEIKI